MPSEYGTIFSPRIISLSAVTVSKYVMSSPRFENLSWKLVGFTAMSFVTHSILHFIIVISLYTEHRYLYGVIELINITLAGWIFFSYFVLPDDIGIVTRPNLEDDPRLLDRVGQLLFFVAMTRFALYSLGDLVEGKTHYSIGSIPVTAVLAITSALALISSVIAYGTLIKRPSKEVKKLEYNIRENLNASKPLKKLQKNLDDQETEELSRLLYESTMLRTTSIRNVARFALFSFIWVLVIEVFTEFVTQLFR